MACGCRTRVRDQRTAQRYRAEEKAAPAGTDGFICPGRLKLVAGKGRPSSGNGSS